MYLQGAYVGETPQQVELDDGFFESYEVKLDKEGYESQTVKLKQDIKVGYLLLDLLCGGPIGIVICGPFNGKRHRENYEFTLLPEPATTPPAPAKEEEAPPTS